MSQLARSGYVYLATSDVDATHEDTFAHWSDEEWLPSLGRVSGVLSARRFVALDGAPRHLTLCETATADARRSGAIDTPGSAELRPHVRTRVGFYGQTYPAEGLFHGAAWSDGAAAPTAILVIRLDIAPEHDEEFEEWYSQEHLPALCGVSGVIGGRIFKAIAGGPKHMTIFHLAVPEGQAFDEWRRAASTPWTMRMRRLVPERWRVVYQPVVS